MENKTQYSGKLENLEEQIQAMLQNSGDYFFTEYLQKLLEKVRREKYQLDLIQADLERSYQLYLIRNPIQAMSQIGQQQQEKRTPDFGQENSALPIPGIPQENIILQGTDKGYENREIPAEALQQKDTESPITELGQENVGSPITEHHAELFSGGLQEGIQQKVADAEPQTMPDNPGNEGLPYTPGVSADNMPGMMGRNLYYQAAAPVQQSKKHNTEFAVGIAVFSVIGVVFILTSFVMLGMNFMNGFAKGISLYAISILLVAISELLIFRRSEKLSMAVSAIGLGGFYLSTVINYLHLHNFNGVTAIMLTAFITAGTFLLSRKKDSWLFRVIGMIACYLCCLPIQKDILPVEFLVVIVVLFCLNILCAALPVRRYRFALGITQMLANSFFSQVFLWRALWCGIPGSYQVVFVISTLLVLNFILFSLLRHGEKEELSSMDTAGLITAFCISAVLFLAQFISVINGTQAVNSFVKHSSMTAIAAICVLFFVLERKWEEKWCHYYFLNVIALALYCFSDNSWEVVICLLVMLAFSKLLTRVTCLKISEAVITGLVCMFALAYCYGVYAYLFIVALIVSVLLIHRWQTFYEILLTGTLALLALIKLPVLLRLPAVVGIFFGGILLFHNVKRFKGSRIIVFNIFALSVQAICFLAMTNRIYTRAYITYVMMLVFGLATIVLTFQENYGMNFSKKHLVMVLFLTYMAFFSRTGIPVLTSILLMAVALFSVGTGFIIKEKSVRIYGLALSLFVCGKVILYDFTGTQSLQKMLLFFVVGLIALIISGIYILLEKKGSHTQMQSDGGNEL